MDQRDRMRAADSDREAVAERLRSALNDGRLDLHEYDERLQQAYAAKTYADLRALLTDLPAEAPGQLVPVAPPMPPELVPGPDGRYPRATQRWLADQWGSYLRVVATTVGIWGAICLMSGGLTYFWPGWVAGPWGAVLLAQTVGGLFGGEPQRWAAKRARKKRAELERAAQGEEPDENAAAQER